MTEAEKLAKPAWDAVHLPLFPADDPGGCDGCETGWCQSAVDAICEGRNQYHVVILPVIEGLLAVALAAEKVAAFGWGSSVTEARHFERMYLMNDLRAALNKLSVTALPGPSSDT